MSIPGSTNPLLLFGDPTGGQYQISRSLRFNSSDSAYLSRTPAVAGSRTTWSFSFWIKRTKASTEEVILDASASGQYPQGRFEFTSGDKLNFFWYDGSTVYSLETAAVYRDFSAWYHILLAFDSTQATSSNRTRIYVNGVEQTLSGSYVAPNTNTDINNTVRHVIGFYQYVSNYYTNSYLADVQLIDGQQLTPSSFTEVSATTGQLIPKTYSGSYGTNGFQLKFADNSSNTASTLGKDTSGLGNNFTPNNLSVTAGAGNDSLVDSPTNYGTDTSVGGEVRGNYCTLNPLKTTFSGDGGLPSHSNGNLDVTGSGGTSNTVGTIGVSSGKFYYETTLTATHDLNACIFGLGQSATAYSNNFGLRPSGSFGGTITSGSAFAFAIGDTVGIAYEPGVSATFYKNNNTSSFVASLSSGIWFPWAQLGGTTVSAVYNFGQRLFVNQSVPSGFKALCTQNLPAPLVAKPNTVMDVVLYTGTGAALTPTSSLGFNPDWIWIKSRSAATDHALYDVVRGAQARLESNTTDAEVTTDGGVTAFNSAGFTLGTLAQVNTSSATYAAWCWDAGTSTVSNTSGSITSQVRANASAGFSVVTYTGTGSAATIGHGLGVSPSLIITKARSNTSAWAVYHASLGATKALEFDTSAAVTTNVYWNNTSPTSTVFSVLNGNTTNTSGYTYVGYCFAPVVGYSSMGSYTGNGSADGPFVYTGFRPRWILIKETSGGESWAIFDTARNTYNTAGFFLRPDSSLQEHTSGSVDLDILSNGFKLRSTNATINAARTYIYAAFAESPFNYSRAR